MKKENLISYKQNIIRCNSGFNYALICGACWGFAYIIISFVMKTEQNDDYSMLILPIILSALSAFIITILSLIFLKLHNKINEFMRTLNSVFIIKKIALASICGIVATFSTYILATSDTVFSTSAVLFYPVLAAIIARKWYREIISHQCAFGIIIILVCSSLTYFPTLFVTKVEFSFLPLFGLLAGICWALEAVIIGKICETSDSDVCLCIRFCFESIIWIVFLPFLYYLKPFYNFTLRSFSESEVMLSILGISIFLFINYVSWYRGIVLIGVSRGTAVSNVSGFVLLILSMVFYYAINNWFVILATSGSLIGIIIIYMDCMNSNGLPILREKTRPVLILPTKKENIFSKTPQQTKVVILQQLEIYGKLWDYEIANHMIKLEKKYSKDYRELIREWTIQMRAMSLIEITEEKIDSGEYFQKGKRLCQYTITK